jgi:bifunctional ADP-heptose synthase (sugar kinase/adenylyltransferase)
MNILVVGDRIIDQYEFCKAVRLSPEAPVPVLHLTSEKTSEGGASLVAENLKSLMGAKNVNTVFGSVSHKRRTFADRTLLSRLDKDSWSALDPKAYWNEILAQAQFASAIVVGDYGKGAIDQHIASGLVALRKPLFVDTKHHPEWYKGCFALFPNEEEHPLLDIRDYQHIIRKLGPMGCTVDGVLVPTKEQQVYDVTGAGDVFLAGFVAMFMQENDTPYLAAADRLRACAEHANLVAGISVRHLGTYVVKPTDLLEESK